MGFHEQADHHDFGFGLAGIRRREEEREKREDAENEAATPTDPRPRGAAPVMPERGFKLPFRLSFGEKHGERIVARPGYGDAGWTVGLFPSKDAALAFMAANPQAAMPCWRTIR